MIETIGDFLRPALDNSDLKLERYATFASGRIIQDIARRRGHCSRITQSYVESGGLRDALPPTVNIQAKEVLDELVFGIAGADADLFEQMTAVGVELAKEGAVITNLLLAEQTSAAEARLRQRASELLPLQQELAQGMGKLDSLAVDLGIEVQ